ncbi:sugar-binding protein [Luteolibacter marinus]|uniref:sugar-binding protein n=1 Tax=Luteolibacter marinus TaxID=2776705 RepID=UPI0018684A40|nr:sugar-binding protein [Luteolibacter marinus]
MKRTQVVRSLAALIACAGLAGCGGKKKDALSLAFVTNGVASFWDIAKAGAEKAGEEIGAEVTVLMPSKGVVEQKQMIEDLLIRGIDGLAVSPIDADNQVEVLDKAADTTKFMTVDSDAPKSKRRLYLGMDNYKAGRMCGQLVKEALPDGGTVMIFVGRLEQDNAKGRRQGVIDELMGRSEDSSRFDPPGEVVKNDKYQILGTLTDQFDRAQGKALVDDTLSRYPDLGCAVGLFVYNPPLILESLERAGKLGQVKVVGFDEAEETLQAITEGTVQGTVVQNPFEYGYRSIQILSKWAKGDESVIPADGFIDIPARIIRKDDAAAFAADLKAKLGR